jgi:CHASE1-domain containing sensor protein
MWNNPHRPFFVLLSVGQSYKGVRWITIVHPFGIFRG